MSYGYRCVEHNRTYSDCCPECRAEDQAEIDQLCQQVSDLKKELKQQEEQCGGVAELFDEAIKENRNLTAENESLLLARDGFELCTQEIQRDRDKYKAEVERLREALKWSCTCDDYALVHDLQTCPSCKALTHKEGE